MDDAQLPQEAQKAVLLQHDEAFRELVHEHHALDEHVRQLTSQHYLTPDEQTEEILLKKRKLAVKDRIEAVLRSSRIVEGTA
jgi:uncharacterized protein YdcH (DUF465 family)